MRDTLKGAFFVISAMLIFALFGIFVRSINLPSFALVFFMFLFTGVILFLYFFIRDRKILNVKKYIWFLVLLGGINVLNNFFFFQSFKLTTISNAVLTHYTAPIFVALFAPLFLKEKVEKITIIALILSIVGLVFVVSNDLSFYGKDFAGIMYGIGSGVMYALVIILIKHMSKSIPVYSINIYQSLIGALILLPFVINSKLDITVNLLLILVVFALIFGITATLLHMSGIKRIRSQHVGILAYIEPVAAIIYGFTFFSEIPSLNTLIGGIFILISGYLIIRREK
jgi:drug/metabolite transporter (DMT)-like permease